MSSSATKSVFTELPQQSQQCHLVDNSGDNSDRHDEKAVLALEIEISPCNGVEREEEREQWTRGLDFILSLIGYAVGVSNLWRFPYLVLRNGGGAFLIPFFFFLFLCGIPLFYLEVCLGQFSGISSMFVWKMCPLFKGLGYGMVIVSGMACIYYNAVLSWVIYYLVNSFQTQLPWSRCGHWWNTDRCIHYRGMLPDCKNASLEYNLSLSINSSLASNTSYDMSGQDLWKIFTEVTFNSTNVTADSNKSSFVNDSLCLSKEIKYRSAAEEFWQFNVLRKTSGLEDLGSFQIHSAACLLAAWVLVCICLIKGIKSLGCVVYVTVLLPYALLTIFLVRGLMLPGSLDGIEFYLKPDFNKLASLSPHIASAAKQAKPSCRDGPQVNNKARGRRGTLLSRLVSTCTRIGFTVTVAGHLVTAGHFVCRFTSQKTYLDWLQDIIVSGLDVLIASLADGLTSFYGGFVIFAVIGFMAKEAGVAVTDIATQGPGLALVAYPEAISKLPLPQFWAVLFFFMLLLLGLDSQFGMFETVVAGLIEAFPQQLRKRRMYLTFSLALFSYLVSLPIATEGGIYVFTLLDWFVSAFCVVITSLIECAVIGWIYGIDRFSDDIQMMMGQRPGILMRLCWTVITPCIMLSVFIFLLVKYSLPVYDGYVFPLWANVIGFIISFIPMVPIPVGMIIALRQQQGSFLQRVRSSLTPAPGWGPAMKKYSALYRERQQQYKNQPHWFRLFIDNMRSKLTQTNRVTERVDTYNS
ncbi:sodium- and chloride-dependent glycine transporter 1-like [Elysia marginata]|uniref:Transporter n=1 Tax=Elysia marginata TaxID=1093978 RepID=A0AAV4JRQ0_9GAST|nr:sodium- and chloride-dependent glycine transporter 1-like [Elysia marginata]